MIAYIAGELVEVWDKACIVRTAGGVGYRIQLPGHTLAALPPQGESVAFYISTAVREDAIELFGFTTFEERQTFEILRAINKVGARTAMSILSQYRPADLRQIILEENIPALTKISGIGQKSAQHIFLELRYKLGQFGKATAPAPMAGTSADVMAALANLGYGENECAGIVAAIIKEEPDIDVGSAIRMALKEIAKGKA